MLRSAAVLAVASAVAAGVLRGQATRGLAHDAVRLPDPLGVATAVRLADMDGDGMADVVRMRDGAVEILLQDQATGRFQRASVLNLAGAAAGPLRDIGVGRFDASFDLLPDVAVLWSNGEVDVLANGGGTLVRTVPRPVPVLPAATAAQLLAGDLDGDQRTDLVVLLDSLRPQVLLAQANGTFVDVTATHVPPLAGFARPRGLLHDLDGDGDRDLVLCSANAVPPILLRNAGSGVLQSANGAFGSQGVPTSRVVALDLGGSALPELVFAASGTAVRPLYALGNAGGTFVAQIPQSLVIAGAADLAVGDVDVDGAQDLLVLQTNGALGFAVQRAGGTLLGRPIPMTPTAEPFALLPPDAGRSVFAAGDLDGDGDVDVLATGECDDALLLHGAGTDFVDTERIAFPAEPVRADYARAFVDRDGNGDPDFVGYFASGVPLAFDNDGSGTFRDVNAGPPPLPSLRNTTVWERVLPLSLVGPGRRDLFVLGAWSPASDQVAVLANAGGSWIEDTAQRFGGASTGAIAEAAVYPSANGVDGVVLATFAGELELHTNQSGVLAYAANAFAGNLGLLSPAALHVADFAGDARADVLVLLGNAPPRLFVASGQGFAEIGAAFPGGAAGDAAAIGDLDLDGRPDVLLRTSGQPGVTAWLANGAGFGAAPSGMLPPLPFVCSAAAIVAVDDVPRIVLGRADAPDQALVGNGVTFSGPHALPFRGTVATTGLSPIDLDRDGDRDLVVFRQGRHPAVLRNLEVHLAPLAVGQAGRAVDVRLFGRQPGELSFLAFGAPAIVPSPWGLLRLAPNALVSFVVGTAPLSRETTWRLLVPPGVPPIALPMQAAWLGIGGSVRVSGLEFLEIVP